MSVVLKVRSADKEKCFVSAPHPWRATLRWYRYEAAPSAQSHQVTSYATLAEDMAASGIKNASPTKARELAEREWRGAPLTDQEAAAFKLWLTRKWEPEIRNVKKPGEEK